MKIIIRKFLWYKFLNSLFLGLSIGSIFTLYTPLNPSIYSMGGVFLALGMLLIAKQYRKILNIDSFYKISLLVEFVLLLGILYFLVFSYSYTTALVVYVGYQVTFVFGSYLVRAETLFLKYKKAIELVDVVKQKGYLVGMLLSYGFYQILEHFFEITDNQIQVYFIHYLLIVSQVLIIWMLFASFKRLK